MANENGNGAGSASHLDEAEEQAAARIETARRVAEEADAASQGALAALSEFMRQIQEAKRLLKRGALTPADALISARDGVRTDGRG